MSEAVPWSSFMEIRPQLASIGRDMFYAFDVGLGFLATVRKTVARESTQFARSLLTGGCTSWSFPDRAART